jgi:hypothetical protein
VSEKNRNIEIKEIALLGALLLAIFTARLFTLYMPLNGQEGTHAYAAAVVAGGEKLYKEVHVHGQPVTYYMYATAFKIFGINMAAVRNFTNMAVLFSIVLLYMLCRMFAGKWLSLGAALIYAITLHNPAAGGFTAAPEVFVHIPLIFAFMFLLERDKGYEKTAYFLTGAFLAAAFFTQASVAPLLIAPLLHIFYFREKGRAPWKNALWYAGGFAAIEAVALAWMLKAGIVRSYWNEAFLWNLSPENSGMGGFAALFEFIKVNPLAAAAMVWSIFKLENRDENPVFPVSAALFAFAAGVFVYAGGTKALLPIAPLGVFLSMLMLSDLYNFMASKKALKKAALATVLCLGAGACVYSAAASGLAGFFTGEKTGQVWLEADYMAMVINAEKKEGDSLATWPVMGGAHFLTNFKSPVTYMDTARLEGLRSEYYAQVKNVYDIRPRFLLLGKEGIEKNPLTTLAGRGYTKISETVYMVLYKKGEE